MWSIITLFGWVLVMVLMLSCRQIEVLLTTGLFAIGTLCLLGNYHFPNREKTLITSWIGPTIILTSWVILRAINPHLYILSIMGGGRLSASLMVWIWRYYGLILVLAIPGTLIRSNHLRNSIKKAAETYPWRFWWVFPAIVSVKACIIAGIVSMVTNRLAMG